MPVTAPAFGVLKRGQGAALQHIDALGGVDVVVQIARGHFAFQKCVVEGQRFQVIQIGFTAIQAGIAQSLMQLG